MSSNMIFLIVLIVSLTVNLVQLEYGERLKANVATYQTEINELKIDSERQADDAQAAYESAQRQMRQIQDKTQKVLRTKVPKTCDGAIKWLVQQAHSI